MHGGEQFANLMEVIARVLSSVSSRAFCGPKHGDRAGV
jgi:hypothetical protein